MATINTNPEMKTDLLRLKAKMAFANSREEVEQIVTDILGFTEDMPGFVMLVDKLCTNYKITKEISSYNSEYTELVAELNEYRNAGKLRYIGKNKTVNIAEEINYLADDIFAQYKRAHKITSISIKKVCGDHLFMVNITSTKTINNICKSYDLPPETPNQDTANS